MSNRKKVKISTGKVGFIESLVMGLTAPFDALNFITKNKGLKRYFVIPFVLNLLILAVIGIFLYQQFDSLQATLLPQGEAWYEVLLRGFVQLLIIIIIPLVGVFCYSIVGGIVSAPFNDPLSEKVEKILNTDFPDQKISLTIVIEDIVRVFKNSLKLILLICLVNILLFFINFLPVIGTLVFSIFAFVSVVFFFGFQFFEFPLERRRLDFKNKLKIVLAYKWVTVGVGVSFFILSFIPIINFLAIALGTIGVTKLYVEKLEPGIEIIYNK